MYIKIKNVRLIFLIRFILIFVCNYTSSSIAAVLSWPTPDAINSNTPLNTAVNQLGNAISACALDSSSVVCQSLTQARADYRNALSLTAQLIATDPGDIPPQSPDKFVMNSSSAAGIYTDPGVPLSISGYNMIATTMNLNGVITVAANSALDLNGDITFSNNNSGSNASASIFGGSIANQGGLVSINNTLFSNNVGSGATLGSVLFGQNGKFAITDSQFLDNSVMIRGGIYLENNDLFISNTAFKRNSGGAIIFSVLSNIFVQNSTFDGNTSSNIGAIIFSSSGVLTVQDTVFGGDAAVLQRNAGSIANAGTIAVPGYLTVNNSQFINGLNPVSSFNPISLEGGGAIINSSKATISNSIFTGNETPGNGGAITSGIAANLADFDDNVILTIIDSSFVQNSSAISGGAINGFGSTINLNAVNSDILFTGNLAGNSPSSVFLLAYPTANTFNAEAGKAIDMRDPMAGVSAGSIVPLVINKTGAGTWRLGGINNFDLINLADPNGRNQININQGQLYLYADDEVANPTLLNPNARVTAAIINLNGPADDFSLGSDGMLVAAGANQINSANTITINSDTMIRGKTAADGNAVGGVVSSLSLNAANGATLLGATNIAAVAPTDNFTLGGNLTGPGGIVKSGAGQVNLSGNNTFLSTTVNTGLLQAQAIDAFPEGGIYTVNDGILDLNNFDLTMSSLSGSTGEVRMGSAVAALNQSTDTSFGGQITGSRQFIKQGDGSLLLTGNSAAYTGETSIEGGTLIVNGSLGGSSIQVQSGGLLKGIGQVSSTLVNGTIAPGNSIGTLTIAGSYIQNPGSTYEVEINSSGQSDRIDISGSATINGGTVQVLNEPGVYSPNTAYRILTAAGGVQGTYSTLIQDLTFINYILTYDSNNVYLGIVRNDTNLIDFADTPNEESVVNAVESLGQSNPIYLALLNLNDITQIRAAYNALTGEAHASNVSVMIEDSRYVREAIINRLTTIDNPSLGANFSFTDAANANATATNPISGWTWWSQGFGSWGKLAGNDNTASVDRETQGIFMGADHALGANARVGWVSGYTQNKAEISSLQSNSDSSGYYAGIYSGLEVERWLFKAGSIYTWNQIDLNRNVIFPNFDNSLTSDYHAGTTQVFTELAYRVNTNHFKIEPFANLAVVNVNSSDWYETAGAAALKGDALETVLYSSIGMRQMAQISYGTNVSERLMLAWRHAYSDTVPQSLQSFTSGSANFLINGVPIAVDSLIIDAGLEWRNSNKKLSARLSYLGQVASNVHDNGVAGVVKWVMD